MAASSCSRRSWLRAFSKTSTGALAVSLIGTESMSRPPSASVSMPAGANAPRARALRQVRSPPPRALAVGGAAGLERMEILDRRRTPTSSTPSRGRAERDGEPTAGQRCRSPSPGPLPVLRAEVRRRRSPPPVASSPAPRPWPRCARSPRSAPRAGGRRGIVPSPRTAAPRSSPAAPSWSTSTCSGAMSPVPERRERGARREVFDLAAPSTSPSGSSAAAPFRLGRGSSRRRCASTAAWRAWLAGRGQPGPGPRLAAGGRPGAAAGRSGRARRHCAARRRWPSEEPPPARARAALPGDRADALRARGRRGHARVPPPLPPRPAGRPADAPLAPLPAAAPALALGGALLGGRQAADRERPRGPDRTPHRRPLGRRGSARGGRRCATFPRRRRSPAGRRPNWPRWTSRPKRAEALRRVAREVAAGRCRLERRRRRPAPAGDSADRSLDRPVPRPLRPRRDGLASGRRPRLHQAGRPPRRVWGAAQRSRRWRSFTLRMSRSADSSDPSPWPASTGSIAQGRPLRLAA